MNSAIPFQSLENREDGSPVRPPSKISKWGKRSGGFLDPKSGLLTVKNPRGSDTGGTSNSNPVGRRKTRWYAGRFLKSRKG